MMWQLKGHFFLNFLPMDMDSNYTKKHGMLPIWNQTDILDTIAAYCFTKCPLLSSFAPKHLTKFKIMNVNEYTTGAEASLTVNIDNNFKEKDGLKSKW